MNRYPKKKKLWKDAFFSSIFVFLVFLALEQIPFDIHIIDPAKGAQRDFEITDILFSDPDNEGQRTIDSRLVLVNIGNNNREQIAKEIRTIRKFNPKVIGLDMWFLDDLSPASDSALVAETRNPDKLVAANFFEYKSLSSKEYDSLIASHPKFRLSKREGYANFVSRGAENTIRAFSPAEHFEGITYHSFSSLIVSKADEKASAMLTERKSETEMINYKGNRKTYLRFDTDEVNDSNPALKAMEGKIVLLGFLGSDLSKAEFELEDKHFTPLNHSYNGRSFPDMFGLIIQANIISMILDGAYINKMSGFWLHSLSFAICYLHMYFFLRYFIKGHAWFHLFAKLVQIVSSVIIVGIALMLFDIFRYKINIGIILVPILLSVDLLYIYDWLAKILNRKFGFKTYLVKVKLH